MLGYELIFVTTKKSGKKGVEKSYRNIYVCVCVNKQIGVNGFCHTVSVGYL